MRSIGTSVYAEFDMPDGKSSFLTNRKRGRSYQLLASQSGCRHVAKFIFHDLGKHNQVLFVHFSQQEQMCIKQRKISG